MPTRPSEQSRAVEPPPSPPIEPMLALLTPELPPAGEFLFEPKWDGFRALVFRSAEDVYIQSRDRKPLDRFFPELHGVFIERLPPGCVLDGEIVIAGDRGLDFDALQMRLHPAASRIEKLARETPAAFVAFDLLAVDGRSLMSAPQRERRAELERLLAAVGSSAPKRGPGSAAPKRDQAATAIHLTPATLDRGVAAEWLSKFEGAGLDGVVAKPLDLGYEPGKRAMLKIKHARTADCVVAGFRWYKDTRDAVGSLLLGLYDEHDLLQHVGVTSSFKMAERRRLVEELAPLRENALAEHPWKDWAAAGAAGTRMPGAQSRWSAGKDLAWEPLRIERVCEVKYDHLQGRRFRHAATFLRWRFDKPPLACRYAQLEVTAPYALEKVFGAKGA